MGITEMADLCFNYFKKTVKQDLGYFPELPTDKIKFS